MSTEFFPIRRAVVTGATSLIGSALVYCLIKAGITVYGVVRPSSKRMAMLENSPLLHLVPCDLYQIETLSKSISMPCDAFFHLAWLGTETRERRADILLQNENVHYSLLAVKAAQNLSCKVFIGAGSQAEYGKSDTPLRSDTPANPISAYGMAKLCAGQMTRLACKEAGMRHVWSRILSVYGYSGKNTTLIDSIIEQLLKGKRPSLTDGKQIWDFLYVSDAADALFCMAKKGRNGAIYVLGSGEALTLRTYIEQLRDVVAPGARLGFGEIPYYSDQAMCLSADLHELTHDTGWSPTISFPEGIRHLVKKIKQNT